MPSAVAGRIENIKRRSGIKSRDLAQLLATTPETVSRWNTGKVEPQRDRLERLLTLEFLLEELSEFYASEEARLWLFSPHRLLGGDTPADRIQNDDSNSVMALIEQLRDGAYV